MSPPLITFFEHQFRSFSEIGLDPVRSRLRDRLFARIDRLNEIAGHEILHLSHKGLRANAFVGIVRAGEFTFEILPKIDYPLSEAKAPGIQPGIPAKQKASLQPVQTAAENLLSLLSYAYNLRFYDSGISGFSTQHDTWLELLTRLFAVDLHQQILSGLSQDYVSRAENLEVLRGRWDVQLQLSHPDHDQRSFDVIYDDLSPDTPLNQVFRFVVEQLLHISEDSQNQTLLKDLTERLRQVTLLPQVSHDLLNRILFNRLNERFQPAFNLACMFLSGSAIQITAGDQAAHAFVFDMNTLFERFTAGFIIRHRQEILPAEWQDSRVIPQSEGASLYLARCGNKNMIRLRPDILFKQRDQPAPVLIADTKYKQLSLNRRFPAIAPEDIYQMLAYSIRYHCSQVLLLYPQNQINDPIRAELEINPPGLMIYAATINLHTPLQNPAALIQEFQGILKFFTKE